MSAADLTRASGPVHQHSVDYGGEGLYVWPVFLVALLAVMAISLPNLLDPMIRFDDYPAYFADPSGFWAKTLHEGRWVNYLWHLREIVTPAWLNFAVYQALWAGFAAAVAVAALGRGGLGWFTVTLALMIVVAPPAVLISLWFNTLLPGLALVTLYAVLACRVHQWQLRALLPVFTVLTFMAYTTYPLLLLAVVLMRAQRRSVVDLIWLLALFTASFIGAVVVVYALNWQVHGIFGVPLADWREAAPASDMAGYVGNLPKLSTSLINMLEKSSFGFFPAIVFHLTLLVGGLIVLLRRAPLEALYLAAGLITGLTLVAAQVLKLGAIVPPRAFIFAWVFYAVIFVRAAQILSETPGFSGRMARNAALLIVGSYLLQVFQQYTTYRAWQGQTVAVAEVLGDVPGTVVVQGDPKLSPAGVEAGVQNALGFVFRMQQLTGKQVIVCADDPARCKRLADAEGTRIALPFAEIRQSEGGVLVTYPE